jgi:hypothetical protein
MIAGDVDEVHAACAASSWSSITGSVISEASCSLFRLAERISLKSQGKAVQVRMEGRQRLPEDELRQVLDHPAVLHVRHTL